MSKKGYDAEGKEVISIDWGFKGDDTVVIIAEKTNEAQIHIKRNFNLSDEELMKAVAVYVKLLSLPKRTIEALEVGDIVITTNQVGRVAFLIETETQRYIYSKNEDWFNITDIIPREAIELLKDLYQKQNT